MTEDYTYDGPALTGPAVLQPADVADLRARLDAANKRADALAAECEEWRQNYAALEVAAIAAERGRKTAEANADQLHISLLAATARAEAAEAALAAELENISLETVPDIPL